MPEFLYRQKLTSQKEINANLDRLQEFQAYCIWRESYITQIRTIKRVFDLLNHREGRKFTHDVSPVLNYDPPSLDLFRKLYSKK